MRNSKRPWRKVETKFRNRVALHRVSFICDLAEREIKPMPCRATSKVYGTISAERQKQMSGLEFVQGLADGTLPLNTMAETLGYDVSEAANGRVVVTAVPDATHLNPAG